MPMLRRLMELKATLVDYERIVDEKNRRLIFFGRHAGLAGMVNTLWSLGKRLEVEGIPSAFSRLKQARAYADLSGAREDLGRVAARIAADGVPAAIHPLVVGFTGYGNVSQGAQEILDLLPVRTITPAELKTVAHDRARDARVIYKVVFKEADLVEPLEAGKAFDLDDYYPQGAGGYRSVFGRYLNDLSVLVNCIYWDERYPRLLTLDRVPQPVGARPQPQAQGHRRHQLRRERLGRMHRQAHRAGKPGLRLRARDRARRKTASRATGRSSWRWKSCRRKSPGNPPSTSAAF
ncbi:MAG: hypothetical protein MZU95_02460 [Desulfomicrobium escambiense]|nr:hypothetical protein [Desulfomicrobium escambiense]